MGEFWDGEEEAWREKVVKDKNVFGALGTEEERERESGRDREEY